MKKYIAEMFGTMVLVLMGCGTAISLSCTSADPNLSSTVIGTALAFGLSVVAMAYTIGGISGCHINPAITLGCLLSGRISGKEAGMYMLFQVIGAILGSVILWGLTSNASLVGTGANVCQEGVSIMGGLLAEVVFTLCLFWLCWVLPMPRKVQEILQDLPLAFLWYLFTWLVFVIPGLRSIRHVV